VQGAALSKKTRIGIILGTGTNAAYLEKAKCVKHWEQERHGEDHVILDSEWGAFGDNGRLDFMKTAYDIEVDNGSLMRRSFT
jgi:hexokinase